MINLIEWLNRLEDHRIVPLFDTTEDLIVNVKEKGKQTLLKRSSEMETAVIETVENNITKDSWEGIIYIMGKGNGENFQPMYIGKAEKKGVSHPISVNIQNISRNQHKFARWGDGIAYHIGDLSHAIFRFEAYKKPSKKYIRWAEALFESFDQPKLKEPVQFFIAPWFTGMKGLSGLPCSLPAVEKEMIAIASVHFSDSLLNVDGT